MGNKSKTQVVNQIILHIPRHIKNYLPQYFSEILGNRLQAGLKTKQILLEAFLLLINTLRYGQRNRVFRTLTPIWGPIHVPQD